MLFLLCHLPNVARKLRKSALMRVSDLTSLRRRSVSRGRGRKLPGTSSCILCRRAPTRLCRDRGRSRTPWLDVHTPAQASGNHQRQSPEAVFASAAHWRALASRSPSRSSILISTRHAFWTVSRPLIISKFSRHDQPIVDATLRRNTRAIEADGGCRYQVRFIGPNGDGNHVIAGFPTWQSAHAWLNDRTTPARGSGTPDTMVPTSRRRITNSDAAECSATHSIVIRDRGLGVAAATEVT